MKMTGCETGARSIGQRLWSGDRPGGAPVRSSQGARKFFCACRRSRGVALRRVFGAGLRSTSCRHNARRRRYEFRSAAADTDDHSVEQLIAHVETLSGHPFRRSAQQAV